MFFFRFRFKNVLTDIQLIQCLVILFGLFNLSLCLFEDQIGKFDWKQSYVGQIKFAKIDTVSTAKKIILATEENVIAALNLKSGQILWRQVLERAQRGQIQYLHVDSNIIVVSGNNPWLIRTWDPSNGRLLWEWTMALPSAIHTQNIKWSVVDEELLQIVPTVGSHIEVTRYNSFTGQNRGVSTKISTPWMTDPFQCVLSGTIYSCINNNHLYYLNLVTNSSQVYTYPVQTLIGAETGPVTISPLPGHISGIVLIRNHIKRAIFLEDKPNVMHHNIPEASSILTMDCNDRNVLLYTTNIDSTLTIIAIDAENGETIEEISTRIDGSFYEPNLYDGICMLKKDKGILSRFLLSTGDETVALFQNSGKVLWTREEALANILAVEFLELPVSDMEASIETEFNSKEGDFIGMLTRRVTSQAKQLHILLMTVLGGHRQQSNQKFNLVRDEFGLHKMIVVVTKVGKLFGIDNLSGQILWKKHLENIGPFSSGSDEKMMLFTQRTTRHYPKTAQCVLIAKNKVLGTGIVFMFNPITGESIEPPLNIGVKIKQAMLVHKQNDEFLRPLLVLDEKDQVHVYPKDSHQNVMDVIKQTFMYDADPQTGILSGYSLAYSTKEYLAAAVTWQAHFGSKDQQLKAAVGKNPAERVHSQGRVLSDRSVLYKYANPNLVAVVTHGSDPVHRHVLNVYLVDAVSGTVVWSVSHKRAKWPVHLVHSENWLVYSYFNDKWRRTEVGTVELYEGTAQTNSTAFSSLASPLLPLAERQAYILPFQLEAMQVTVTEKGITSKHVLMALNNGAVLEMPWAFLDPRRPAAVTPEMREEGVIPYAPELPVPYEAVINYNRSLPRVSGIHVAPSGLESTCLVLVHGLDLFYTRIAPSKTFDLLKDDFDYYLIVIVLGALLLASYITKRLASRKALKQAWN